MIFIVIFGVVCFTGGLSVGAYLSSDDRKIQDARNERLKSGNLLLINELGNEQAKRLELEEATAKQEAMLAKWTTRPRDERGHYIPRANEGRP